MTSVLLLAALQGHFTNLVSLNFYVMCPRRQVSVCTRSRVQKNFWDLCPVATIYWRHAYMLGWVFTCYSCPNAEEKSTADNKSCLWDFLDKSKQGKINTVFMTRSELRYSMVCSSTELWYALNTLNRTCLLQANSASSIAWESSICAVIWHSASASLFCWQRTIIFTERTQTKFYSLSLRWRGFIK